MTTLPLTSLAPEADVLRVLNKRKPGSTDPRFLPFEETDFSRRIRQLIRDWEVLYRSHLIQPSGRKDRAFVAARAGKPLLRRDFVQGSFDLGGRYAGWWMELNAVRRSALTVDGEACTELDFQCVSPRIAYALEGQPRNPDEDLYILWGRLADRFPREAVKIAFATLLYTYKKGKLRAPAGLKMPSGETFDNLALIIRASHPTLRPWFCQGRIAEIQRVESDIATLVMEIFTYDLRRPVLPVHDSFIVAKRDEKALGLAMGYAFSKVVKDWTGLNALPNIRGLEPETAKVILPRLGINNVALANAGRTSLPCQIRPEGGEHA
jgi:hypothetical protein